MLSSLFNSLKFPVAHANTEFPSEGLLPNHQYVSGWAHLLTGDTVQFAFNEPRLESTPGPITDFSEEGSTSLVISKQKLKVWDEGLEVEGVPTHGFQRGYVSDQGMITALDTSGYVYFRPHSGAPFRKVSSDRFQKVTAGKEHALLLSKDGKVLQYANGDLIAGVLFGT